MRRHRRKQLELLDRLDDLMTARRRASVPVLLWRWRKELVIISCAAVLSIAVAAGFGTAWLITGLSALIGALSPPWSPRLRACTWQLITPHLLRAGFYHAGLRNLSGRQPLILRVSREPFGERVRVRCPPGICAEDIDDAREVLRAACRAADIAVSRDERRSHLVTLDVIRRPDDTSVAGIRARGSDPGLTPR